jgi:anthranilate phosphoribosyltransferase
MEILEFLKQSVAGVLTIDQQQNFLKEKREISARELAEAVNFLMEEKTSKIEIEGAIDVCGTGGSGLSRINTSTISAFVLASLGVKVAKHGNKAASGRFGSFDLLEELGVDFEAQSKEGNLTFLYARKFYPVMKNFAEVRKEIGQPTFFNILGPLLSPVRAKRQIIGTAFRDKMRLIAETCRELGRERVFVVCGEDGLDEVTLCGKTKVVELRDGEIKEYEISSEDFGISNCEFEEIEGGDKDFNLQIVKDIFNGECEDRHLDLVLVNCALALKLDGVCDDLKKGYEMAREAVVFGKALRIFLTYVEPNILTQIVADKIVDEASSTGKRKSGMEELEKSDRDFYKVLKKEGISVIAEIKKKSPSKGVIAEDVDVAKWAREYEENGAQAISVLCEENYFGGKMSDMNLAREATLTLPILAKDFIFDEAQIYSARENGADAILLIAGILTKQEIEKYQQIAEKLGMDVLCEVHNEVELKKVLKTSIKIIGINNRDLKTFEIDIETTNRLVKLIPEDKVIVSESGILSDKEMKVLDKRVDAVLVGTVLMQKGAKFINQLKSC